MFKKISLLLVEDDEDLVKLITKYLKGTKYKLNVCYTGESAIDIVKSKSIDIALVDYKLPYKNGILITNEIKSIRNIPIILETGEKMMCENSDMIKEFNFDDIICKPFDKSSLLDVLNKNLK